MGITNVGQQYKIDFAKLASSKRAGRASVTSKPSYLQMSGSIFSAPGTTTPTALASENIRKSIGDFSGGRRANGRSSTGTASGKSPYDFSGIDSVSAGKAGISKINGLKSDVQAATRVSQSNARTAQRMGADANKSARAALDDDKKFKAQFQKQQSELKQTQQKTLRLIRQQEETQREVQDLQHELNSLTATNSTNMTGGSATAGRVKELQTIIGSKVGSLQQNGRAVYSLQRASNRTIRGMQRTSRNYVKAQVRNQKSVETKQSTADKIIEVATKAEAISQLVSTGGQTLKLAGVALVALGAACNGTGFGTAFGSAMIATGNVMQKIGSVAQLVGQYGSTAANLTKSVTYATQGNLQGAMQSFVSAAQTGAACVQGTMGLKGEFGEIDAAAQKATDESTIKGMAKQEVRNMSDDDFKKNYAGMTRKEATKALNANMQAQYESLKGNLDGVTRKHVMNARSEQVKAALKAETTDADGNVSSILNKASKKANADFKAALPKGAIDENEKVVIDENGKIVGLEVDKDGKEIKGGKKARKNIGKAASYGFVTAKDGKGGSGKTKLTGAQWAERITKFSSGMQQLVSVGASMFGANMTGNMYGMNGMTGMNANQYGMNGMTNMYGKSASTGKSNKGYSNYSNYTNYSNYNNMYALNKRSRRAA